jgi:hypothetical protein
VQSIPAAPGQRHQLRGAQMDRLTARRLTFERLEMWSEKTRSEFHNHPIEVAIIRYYSSVP